MNAVAEAGSSFQCPRTVIPPAAEVVASWLDDFTKMYLLSFLLTADKMMAERCFSDAMEESVSSSGAAADWANGPGRGAVVRRAIQAIRPVPKRVQSWSFASGARPLLASAHEPFSVITSLGAFERFVFILTVLEGQSEEECAALLECELEDIADSRDLANGLTADLGLEDELQRNADLWPVTTTLVSQHCGLC
jgi:hypothetical protein